MEGAAAQPIRERASDFIALQTKLSALAQRAARGKRRSGGVARFLLDIDSTSAGLAEELRTHRYQQGTGRAFWIRDPKPRQIFALPFRDRVVQHLLIDQTLSSLERQLRAQTYACRTGRGTHRALRRAADLHRTHTHVARVDVRKFFPSIDHAILRRLLDRVTPPPWRWLRDRFLNAPYEGERVCFHFPGDTLLTPMERPHGLPIGSLTSQLWANLYLSPLDDLLASHLRIGSFVRYCDDILIYHDDQGRLREALAQLELLARRLRLRLHEGKTRLHRTSEPVPFVGFVLQRRGSGVAVRLRHDNLVRMRQRCKTLRALFAAGALPPEELTQRLCAWLAHARHGHTRALVAHELSRLSFALAEP